MLIHFYTYLVLKIIVGVLSFFFFFLAIMSSVSDRRKKFFFSLPLIPKCQPLRLYFSFCLQFSPPRLIFSANFPCSIICQCPLLPSVSNHLYPSSVSLHKPPSSVLKELKIASSFTVCPFTERFSASSQEHTP